MSVIGIPAAVQKHWQLAVLALIICLTSVKCSKLPPPMNALRGFIEIINKNPVSLIVKNSYSFFYNFPKRNILYDRPTRLFKNSTADFIAWYQFPHNLPPYAFVGAEVLPADFFCWGLPGNTLPLGNWDPWGFQLTSPKVVKKYRESEMKHGRVAMLATIGCIVQEVFHPLHDDIGGLAVTHMSQLKSLSSADSAVGQILASCGVNLENSSGLDYYLTLVLVGLVEATMFTRVWERWERSEYNHQFDHNIGLGNLKESCVNGRYGFDPLNLLPKSESDQRTMIEMELNHGRLAMVAFVGIFAQEYLTGIPISRAVDELFTLIDVDKMIGAAPWDHDVMQPLKEAVLNQFSQSAIPNVIP